ncbi:MAG: ATP-binding cassette, subfamily multidrug efflux pump [Clostridiales bacterium]|nr:ATP-binding cassette, subfamily multidrug efflux pump [Clostridiales bacterium]
MEYRIDSEYSLRRDKKALVIRLLKYFKPYLPLLALNILFAFLINGATIIKPYIIKYVIDNYLALKIYAPDVFMRMGLLYLAVVLAGCGLTYSQAYILTYIGQKIMYDIRNQLFTHIQNMSMKFFDRNSSGRILTRVTNDVEALNEIFSGVLVNSIRDIIMILGIIATMFAMDASLALISMCSIPLIALVTVIYRRAARKNFMRMKVLIGRINGFLAENISGMKLVRIFHREKEKLEEFQKLDKEYFDTSLREVVLNSLGRPIIEVINTLIIALLIWYASGRITGGYLEIGVLYAFITYIRQFFAPINEIAEFYTSIQSALISAERIFDVLDTREFLEDMERGRHVKRIRGEIEFKNVWFAYDDENWVLKDVSFKIEPGETVAFVGATGSGKSTIINLMARFYDIQKGKILIDGVDIREYNLKDLRRQIAVVMQDVFLFSGDVKSNIRLRNSSITDEDIVRAARLVCADRFIESLPNKYDEEVKERGCTFSAGQRQLISFARAVAFNPAVFVLDEATANIDTETEMAIQQAMANISGGRTTIIIAHRLSTIRNADKIIVIDKGRIKEIGTHDELIKKGGLYRQLYEKQLVYQCIA